jgi:quercetin dioxygenase-like cupin family protein
MSSAVPLRTDIARRSRHVARAPITKVAVSFERLVKRTPIEQSEAKTGRRADHTSPDADLDTTGRFVMLTRRDFGSIASCALCAVTGFIATDASAQTTPPAATPGVTRKILSQIDGPTPGYVTIIVEAEIEAGVTVARHTHPGIESAYIIEGGLDLPIEGQPTRTMKPGDGFVVPPNTPHAGGKNGDKKTKIASTYVVEKGKPLASPA